jgi:uncharacterized membrane protein YdjX (TVP38/TMEM64 family)
MNETGTNDKRQRTLSIIILVVTLVILFIIVSYFSKELQAVGNFIRRLGVWGWLASILMFAVFGATPIPSEPFTVLITTIFGPLLTAIITALGNLLAATVEFFIGRRVGKVADFDKIREKLPFGLNKVPVDSPIFLIGARLIPGYLPKFVSIISGIYKVPLYRFLWTTLVATTAGALAISFGGHTLLTLLGPK